MRPFALIFLYIFLTASPAEASDFFSAAHVGYAVEDASSTGFQKTNGSALFFDMGYQIHEKVQAGLRTWGAGAIAEDATKFQRVSSGPFVSGKVYENISLQAGMFFFQEAAAASDGDLAYVSKGLGAFLGWERSWAIGAGAEIALGGFISRHQGNIQKSIAPAALGRFADVDRNVGGSRGIDFSLRMPL